MKESELEKMCIACAKEYSTIAIFKIKPSGQKHSYGGKSFHKKSSIPGFPDLLLCIDSHFIGVELKSDDGRQSEVQKICQAYIENAHGMYYIVRSIEQFKSILDKHL